MPHIKYTTDYGYPYIPYIAIFAIVVASLSQGFTQKRGMSLARRTMWLLATMIFTLSVVFWRQLQARNDPGGFCLSIGGNEITNNCQVFNPAKMYPLVNIQKSDIENGPVEISWIFILWRTNIAMENHHL